MSLEKYLPKLAVVTESSGLKELVVTKDLLVKPEESKPVCLWLLHEPAPRIGCEHEKDGLCTHLKPCNQKGVWKD